MKPDKSTPSNWNLKTIQLGWLEFNTYELNMCDDSFLIENISLFSIICYYYNYINNLNFPQADIKIIQP